MDNLEILAMKQEIMLDDDGLVNACQQFQRHDVHKGEATSVKEEEEENLEQPELVVIKEEPDDEMQSGTPHAGCSGQEEVPAPRTEAQGAGQEDDGPSQRGNEPTYPCNVCHKSFSTKSVLVRHMVIHTGERPFTCDSCGRSFCYKSVLQRHILTHSGERPYVCETCSKGFTSRNKLNQHARLHTGDKPFKCNACNRCFADKSNLAVHARIHTGNKRFICEMCGLAFSRKDSLEYHLHVHSGERPFRCETCGSHFIVKRELRKHIVRRHKHQPRESATMSVKEEEEEECLAQPEFILCSNNGDDAEELMENQLVDPLSTAEMEIENDINCFKS